MSNIGNFIKSILPGFKKSEAEEDLLISLENIKIAIESYSSWAGVEVSIGYKTKEVKTFIDKFYKELKQVKHSVKLVSNNRLAKDMVTLLINARVNGEYLRNEISENMNDVVMSQALSAYKANLLRSVAHYYFISNYALMALNYIYVKEATNAGYEVDKDFVLNKKQEEVIEKHINIFGRLLAVYGDEPDKFREIMDSLAEVTLTKANVDELASNLATGKIDIFNALPNGFIGSPIYSVRLIFAQWEADRYRGMKDKKRLLELRFLHYKMLQEQGTSDPSVEKEISYLQKRITDLDYKISKIERDL